MMVEDRETSPLIRVVTPHRPMRKAGPASMARSPRARCCSRVRVLEKAVRQFVGWEGKTLRVMVNLQGCYIRGTSTPGKAAIMPDVKNGRFFSDVTKNQCVVLGQVHKRNTGSGYVVQNQDRRQEGGVQEQGREMERRDTNFFTNDRVHPWGRWLSSCWTACLTPTGRICLQDGIAGA